MNQTTDDKHQYWSWKGGLNSTGWS